MRIIIEELWLRMCRGLNGYPTNELLGPSVPSEDTGEKETWDHERTSEHKSIVSSRLVPLTNANSAHYSLPEHRPGGFWTRHLKSVEPHASERTCANNPARETLFRTLSKGVICW